MKWRSRCSWPLCFPLQQHRPSGHQRLTHPVSCAARAGGTRRAVVHLAGGGQPGPAWADRALVGDNWLDAVSRTSRLSSCTAFHPEHLPCRRYACKNPDTSQQALELLLNLKANTELRDASTGTTPLRIAYDNQNTVSATQQRLCSILLTPPTERDRGGAELGCPAPVRGRCGHAASAPHRAIEHGHHGTGWGCVSMRAVGYLTRATATAARGAESPTAHAQGAARGHQTQPGPSIA